MEVLNINTENVDWDNTDKFYLYVFWASRDVWKKMPLISRFWLRLYAFVMPKTLFKLEIKD
jgi:hypothetical protein